MARVKYIQKARESSKDRRCFTCQKEILVGEPYKRVGLKTGPRSSTKRYWCNGCTPRQSQLTTNSRMSTLYGIEEMLSACVSLDELQANIEGAAEDADAVADEYEESADNMPENLQYGSQAEEMRDKAGQIHEWADELRNIEFPDEDECANCSEDRDAPCHDEANEEEFEHEFEEHDLESIEIPPMPL